MQRNIKVAIAGVGNCASALAQGVEHHRNRRNVAPEGVMRHGVGGYRRSPAEPRIAYGGVRPTAAP
jgi:myo-inositol-1-phosphate synthase